MAWAPRLLGVAAALQACAGAAAAGTAGGANYTACGGLEPVGTAWWWVYLTGSISLTLLAAVVGGLIMGVFLFSEDQLRVFAATGALRVSECVPSTSCWRSVCLLACCLVSGARVPSVLVHARVDGHARAGAAPWPS